MLLSFFSFIACAAISGELNPDVQTVPTDSIAVSTVDEAEKLRERYRLLMQQKNSVGSKAADFRFISRDGSEMSLHSIASEKDIVLLFYDPDCDDCHEAIEYLANIPAACAPTVVAIDSEEDRLRWNATATTLPSEWIVGFALDPIQENETYYISQMPSIYLLDKNKNVILKDASVEQVAGR